ncbi:putative SMC5, structural maintenance of chromosome protein 5, partial [Daphnia magna]
TNLLIIYLYEHIYPCIHWLTLPTYAYKVSRWLPSWFSFGHHGYTKAPLVKSWESQIIVRIHLKDFMTYNEVEFIPVPNLNLILGPNGTGKSTIVSAICLGMAGKPSTIARASNIEQIIHKLHIQVDNHCQFLPQEQVQNFSRMKDKQLLIGTMKVVGTFFCLF